MACVGCEDRLKLMKNIFYHNDQKLMFKKLTGIEIEFDLFACFECIEKLEISSKFKDSCQLNYEKLMSKNTLKDECTTFKSESLEAIYVSNNNPTNEEQAELFNHDVVSSYEEDLDSSKDEPEQEKACETNDKKHIRELILNYETGKMEILKKRKLKGLAPESRKSYTAKTKIEIVQFAELKGNREASRFFKINESSIRGWRKQKEKLLLMQADRRTFRKGSPYWPELERDLKNWVEQERKLGKTVTSFHMKLEAIKMARERNIKNFSGTKKWLYSFMRRNNIPARSRKKRNLVELSLPQPPNN